MTDGKLADLNGTLMGVENELLKRKVSQQDQTIDDAMDIINTAVDDGAIEFDFSGCDGCDDEEDAGATQDSDDGDVPTGDVGDDE